MVLVSYKKKKSKISYLEFYKKKLFEKCFINFENIMG